MSQAIFLSCPKCDHRCKVRPKERPFKVRCPGCEAAVRVPAESELKVRNEPEVKRTPGRRKLNGTPSEADEGKTRRSGKSSTARRRSSSSFRSRESVSIQCPDCKASFSADAADYGKKTSCPLCSTSVEVPDPSGMSQLRKARQKKKPHSLLDGEIAPAPREHKEKLPTGIMLYIDGVLTFPFQPEVIFRLCLFAALIFILDVTVDLCVYALMTVPYALRALGLSAIVMFIITGGHAAVTFQTIFEETSAGSKDVRGWLEFDKYEYAFRLLTIGWLFLIATVAGFVPVIVIGFILEKVNFSLPGQMPLAMLLMPIGFLLSLAAFPFVALSTFEQHSYFSVFSPRIFKSLFREWWSWIIVTFVTWAFFLPWVVMRMVGSIAYPFINLFILSPYFAFIFFVYSRILGRLAFKIAQSADWD
ncbi:hypothetical protein Pla110_20500 [Polystyrenella longa]|uniref:Uncharacterized protein n=2 Tax=Polystyrenella longa TaxID=2528007 RepID=A0A518CMA2_9PLAN|nr:hypothetical protein Pla110_20500 [Polystyrenella longa]